ncbi:MAG: hypothetical protein MUF07_07925 [Steroidobacteraceae bacterium]|nr:hypothetical protein [Steroidobacteraceae bacterium]
MAIATFDRDPARHGGASEPRFTLLEELFRTGDAAFWRAQDRRGGRSCVVRVFDCGREDTSRRLGELHRERTLAERLGHPAVLRTDVPLIEAGRIHQLVDPEPAQLLLSPGERGRLALLTALVAVARALGEVHARGAFHGGFGRDSCLRTADGRVVLQGFAGDAPAPAAVREGIAADHRAFLELAQQLLEPSGGPPPRLRRYFQRHAAAGGSRVAADALASLADELRESLEDTFPWPPVAGAAFLVTPMPVPALAPVAAPMPAPGAAPPQRVRSTAAAPAAPTAAAAPAVASANSAVVIPAAPVATAAAVVPSAAVAALPTVASPAPAPAPVVLAAARAGGGAPPGAVAGSAVPATAAPPTAAAAGPPRDEVTRSSIRPWLAAILLIGAAIAAWQLVDKGGAGSRSRPAAVAPAPVATAAPAVDRRAARVSGPMAAPPPPVERAATQVAPAPVPATTQAPAPARRPAAARVVAPAAPAAGARRAAAASPAGTAAAAPAAESAQAARSRVANLVAGGNRALNALEPTIAGEAFAAALALAPDDRAALEGRQRARRLAGVAALMRDARDASARGDHARAVQGYAQALSNDPRNRGLADALATARRSLARDANGSLLAEGHAALGAGRLEAAREAFERVLAVDPSAAAARRGVEQALTAIALRDQATARRVAALDSTR